MNAAATNSKTLFEAIKYNLSGFEPGEAHAMALLLMAHFYKLSFTQILAGKRVEAIDFSEIIHRLNRHEPIQYVLGQTEFYRRNFFVSPGVLIPRPETELLVEEVVNECRKSPTILDVGTGSGCIAITLKLEMPLCQVHALDISLEALLIAQKNALAWHAEIDFINVNFLTAKIDKKVDFLVSNPPYILEWEKESMQQRVLLYEPTSALFVPHDDPLLFYRAIAEKSNSLLKPDGKIFVEINERFGHDVQQLFKQHGFLKTKVIKDLDGKDRIVTAER